MTKEQFDIQQWRKGMTVRNSRTGTAFEVVGVDFSGNICVLIHGQQCWFPYEDYEVKEED